MVDFALLILIKLTPTSNKVYEKFKIDFSKVINPLLERKKRVNNVNY